MRNYSALLLICTMWTLLSCNQDLSEIKYGRYDNGDLKFIKYYKEGLLDGQAQWFYRSGIIEQLVMFRRGKENGNAYYFYNSGALKSHRYWRNGKMTGYVADYFDDTVGMIKSVLLYNSNGDLIYRKNFDNLGHFISEEGEKPE